MMTKQEQINELAYMLCLTYYTGLIDGKIGSKKRKELYDNIITMVDKDWEKWIPHAEQLIDCLIPRKQTKSDTNTRSVINSILELDV